MVRSQPSVVRTSTYVLLVELQEAFGYLPGIRKYSTDRQTRKATENICFLALVLVLPVRRSREL